MTKNMWLRYIKPALLSLLLFIFLQITTFCLLGYFPYKFEWLSAVTFVLLLNIILIVYRTCSRERGCRYRGKFAVFAIPPIFLFLGLIGFLFFNTSAALREIFIILATGAYFIIFSEIFSRVTHAAHDVVKFLIIFLLFDSVLELVHYFKLPLYFILLLILAITLLLLHHMFWRLLALKKKYSLIGICVAIFLGTFTWIAAYFWPLASYFVLAIMIMSLYYVAWGMLHHHIDFHLTKRIVLDYILIGAFVFLMALGLIFLS
jgi:hypothetical protein